MKRKLSECTIENLNASLIIDSDGMATIIIHASLGLDPGDTIPLKRGGTIISEKLTSPLVGLLNGHAII